MTSDLDETKRDKEFAYTSDKLAMLPIESYDSFLKEGKVGFFCTQCNGLKLSNIQLWADDCQVVSKGTGFPNLLSPCSHRLIENYKMSLESKFTIA